MANKQIYGIKTKAGMHSIKPFFPSINAIVYLIYPAQPMWQAGETSPFQLKQYKTQSRSKGSAPGSGPGRLFRALFCLCAHGNVCRLWSMAAGCLTPLREFMCSHFLSLLGGRNLQHLLGEVCIKGNDCAIY